MHARPALPEPLVRYLGRVVPSDRPAPRELRIVQEGWMRLKPGGRQLPFTAVQHLAVDRVAFSWRAAFPLLGPLGLRVVDGFAEGEGRLDVCVLGLPLQRARGPEVAAGEALRYLAELPWVPYAAAHNSELEWRGLDGRSVEVATRVTGDRLAAKLEFDDAGDLVRSSSEMRLLRRSGGWVATPWSGLFGDYARLGGVRIPTHAEAAWELEGGRFVYWRGTVTSAEPIGEPSTPVVR